MTRFIVSYVNDGERYKEHIDAGQAHVDTDGVLRLESKSGNPVAQFRLWAHYVQAEHDAYESGE